MKKKFMSKVTNWIMLAVMLISVVAQPTASLAATIENNPEKSVLALEAEAKQEAKEKDEKEAKPKAEAESDTGSKEKNDNDISNSENSNANDSPEEKEIVKEVPEGYEQYFITKDQVENYVEEKGIDKDEDLEQALARVNQASSFSEQEKLANESEVIQNYKRRAAMARAGGTLTEATRTFVNVNRITPSGLNYLHDYIVRWQINGEDVFCIQEGVWTSAGLSYSSVDLNSVLNNTALMDKLTKIAWFGHFANVYNKDSYNMTQMMVWGAIGGKFLDYGAYGSGYTTFSNDVNSKISAFQANPSFHDKSYTVKANSEIEIKDTSGVFANWDGRVVENTTGATIRKSGNSVFVKATSANTDGRIRLAYFPASHRGVGASFAYQSGNAQKLSNLKNSDPKLTTINIKVQKEGKLRIQKVDDTGKALPGVEIKFTVNGKSTTSKTDTNGFLDTPLYDIGTVVEYEETATIAGHYIDPATSKGKVTLKEGTNTVTIKNPRYANLTLIKKNDAGVAMDGVVFKLTADGKSEEYTTKDGMFDIKNKFKDGTVVEYEEIKTIPGHYIDPKTSKGSITVKSGENTINVKNPRYANLTLVKKNDKGEPMDGVTFKLIADGKSEEYTTKDGGLIDVKNKYKDGTKVDWEEIKTIKGHYIDPEKSKGSITVKSGENTLNVENPTLNFGVSSQASNQDGAQFVNPMQGQKLRDEVMIQANQAPANAKLRVINDFVEFGTGEQLGEESLQQIIEFEAKQAQFVKFVDREFDATDMHGKKGVHTNILEYYNPSTEEWEEVARDDDLNNEAQSIQFVHPKIHTEFFFYDHEGNETKITDPLKKVKGYDRAYYEYLISGQTYKFDLTMMNRETGKEFLDPNGNKVTGMIEIVAGEDGEVTSSISAKEYYENLAKEADEKDGDKEKEESTDKEDSEDPDETEIKPLAEGEEEANNEENTETEETEDPTEFSTLNEVVLLTGHVDIPFEADLSAANGNILVAYEQVSTNDTPVAEHKDIEDEKQSGKVRNPEISTKALVNGVKEVTEDGKLILEDTAYYNDLTPGVEYEQNLTWMVKNTGEALKINQKEVTGTIKFTPEKESGEVTVKVIIDGKELFENYGDAVDLVAFEETTRDGELIAEHKDINDEGQTVRINKPVVPATPKRTLPQTSGSESNSTAWIMLALVIVVGAILVFANKKRAKK